MKTESTENVIGTFFGAGFTVLGARGNQDTESPTAATHLGYDSIFILICYSN
jgi:hypothetical protein